MDHDEIDATRDVAFLGPTTDVAASAILQLVAELHRTTAALEAARGTFTAETARLLPGAFTAYRRTDGELMQGEYAWMSDDWGECWCDSRTDEPDEYEEVVMVPVRVRVFGCHEQEAPEECPQCGSEDQALRLPFLQRPGEMYWTVCENDWHQQG